MRGINKLGPDELFLPNGFGNFQALTASTLGNEITALDGWDNDINQVASTLASDLVTIGDLDSFLNTANFVPGELDSSTLLPLLQDHAALVSNGDPLLDDFGSIAGSPPGQSPPPPPEPGPGGGPGGGASGGPGGGTGGAPGGEGGASGGAPAVTCILFDHANAKPTTECFIEGATVGGGVHPPLQE